MNKKQNPKKDSKKNLNKLQENDEIKEKQMMENLNQQNMLKYLNGIRQSKFNKEIVGMAGGEAIDHVVRNIRGGSVEMPDQTTDVSKLLVSVEEKITTQEIKQMQLKNKRDGVQKKIQYLDEQIRKNQPHSKSKSNLEVEAEEIKEVLTKEEHQQKMQSILAHKKERRRKHKEMLKEMDRKSKEEEEKRNSLINLEKQKEKLQKRKDAESNMEKRRHEHERFLSMQIQTKKQYGQAKKKEHLYQKLEHNYQTEVLLPSLEEKKVKLKKIRDLQKNYDLEAIKEHQRNYLLKRQDLSKSELEKSRERKKRLSMEYAPPGRSQRLSKILEQEQIRQKDLLEEKKKKIDEKLRRQGEYLKQLQNKHRPRIDPEKKREIQNRLLIQRKKKEPNQRDTKKIGQQYLEIAKKLRRVDTQRHATTEKSQKALVSSQKESNNTYHQQNRYKSQQFIENLRRKNIDEIVNSEETVQSKYLQLKMESQKITEKLQQKEQIIKMSGKGMQIEDINAEAAELVLSSLRAKMGIMALLKRNPQNE